MKKNQTYLIKNFYIRRFLLNTKHKSKYDLIKYYVLQTSHYKYNFKFPYKSLVRAYKLFSLFYFQINWFKIVYFCNIYNFVPLKYYYHYDFSINQINKNFTQFQKYFNTTRIFEFQKSWIFKNFIFLNITHEILKPNFKQYSVSYIFYKNIFLWLRIYFQQLRHFLFLLIFLNF